MVILFLLRPFCGVASIRLFLFGAIFAFWRHSDRLPSGIFSIASTLPMLLSGPRSHSISPEVVFTRHPSWRKSGSRAEGLPAVCKYLIWQFARSPILFIALSDVSFNASYFRRQYSFVTLNIHNFAYFNFSSTYGKIDGPQISGSVKATLTPIWRSLVFSSSLVTIFVTW